MIFLFKGDFEHLNEKGTLVQYDAFVLYSREDQEFVDMVVEKMEGEYGMKVCHINMNNQLSSQFHEFL